MCIEPIDFRTLQNGLNYRMLYIYIYKLYEFNLAHFN